jgi:hypothetical protein
MVFGHFEQHRQAPERGGRLAQRRIDGGRDAFFEEGIHWLQSRRQSRPKITRITGFRPAPSSAGPDKRVKSMLVSFNYDNGAVGSLYYSREIPSMLKGLRLSKLMGRKGVITFESNGAVMLVRGDGFRAIIFPASATFAATRRCIATSANRIQCGRAPK